MYSPVQFQEHDPQLLQALMRDYPLACLITPTSTGTEINHLPLLWRDDGSEQGVLHGHVARNNPVWREYDRRRPASAVFQGPNAYISPTWYVGTREHGKVVPTWNYAVVHAHGRLRVVEDAAWLYRHLAEMTDVQEAGLASPWALADAPAEFTGNLLNQIIGIEIAVERLEGKWKVSQNQPIANRLGVIAGLQSSSQPQAAAMADLVRRRLPNGD
ncbi:FMN-binding negative transcriptional regulator [Methylomonas koyamae]|uniref:FMN-binding negative transcriptional regulator n=1 Tax=Methylomonas koyamae TaxID=702114 RepID=UPI00112A20C0|nr:FMN-binding negative transcriptional regulator [Methylomonas koyamae]TPQ27924.1 transcriptional regulator [Methylomonas koyamae]